MDLPSLPKPGDNSPDFGNPSMGCGYKEGTINQLTGSCVYHCRFGRQARNDKRF